MIHPSRSAIWGILVCAAAALALGGCGRKGPLDLPPTAASASTAIPVATDTEIEQGSRPSVFNPNYGADAPPAATRGTKKPFLLDPLLDK